MVLSNPSMSDNHGGYFKDLSFLVTGYTLEGVLGEEVCS
jgi:hypothetical protein